jgi:hypothetical protein
VEEPALLRGGGDGLRRVVTSHVQQKTTSHSPSRSRPILSRPAGPSMGISPFKTVRRTKDSNCQRGRCMTVRELDFESRC